MYKFKIYLTHFLSSKFFLIPMAFIAAIQLIGIVYNSSQTLEPVYTIQKEYTRAKVVNPNDLSIDAYARYEGTFYPTKFTPIKDAFVMQTILARKEQGIYLLDFDDKAKKIGLLVKESLDLKDNSLFIKNSNKKIDLLYNDSMEVFINVP